GVTVAVIDTGIDLDHPAFEGHLTGSGGWRDWVDGDRVPNDDGNYSDPSLVGYGHGTNVASILAQVAPKAKILPLRVLAPNGAGNVADVVAAINYAVSAGANVINLSVGSANSSDVDKAVLNATSHGVYVVASSGNTGNEAVTAPARYATLGNSQATMSLSVGSVDRNDMKSSFSTYGSKLELLAPGEGMLGAAPEGLVEAWSGTSMASPIASGVLALALGELPPGQRAKWVGRIAEQLAVTADPVDAVNDPLLVDQLGRGRLNAEKFIMSVLAK
ncbi:S8 family serine peptidase, partial [Deinococcus sp.]|uniref:S8 family serine peptidase n=1 Tax=Deinococcus sp. TaxID=47478 RepID=UPI002869A76B